MHFLSHYYVELPNDNPLFVTALAIPDLCANFSKIYNSVIKKSVLTVKRLEPIQQGIEAHFAADKRFHQSAFFNEYLDLLLQAFIHGGLNRERLRLSVIAHLGIELLIDRQIVIQEPEICTTYYRLIHKADQIMLSEYFDILLLEAAKKNFLARFNSFKQRQFIMLFIELHYLVFGLDRMYATVTGTGFTEDEKGRIQLALGNIDARIRYSWKEILKV